MIVLTTKRLKKQHNKAQRLTSCCLQYTGRARRTAAPICCRETRTSGTWFWPKRSARSVCRSWPETRLVVWAWQSRAISTDVLTARSPRVHWAASQYWAEIRGSKWLIYLWVLNVHYYVTNDLPSLRWLWTIYYFLCRPNLGPNVRTRRGRRWCTAPM